MILSILTNPVPYAITLLLIVLLAAAFIHSVNRNNKYKQTLINDEMVKKQTKKVVEPIEPTTDETVNTTTETEQVVETTTDVSNDNEACVPPPVEETPTAEITDEQVIEHTEEIALKEGDEIVEEVSIDEVKQEIADNLKAPQAGQSLGHVHDNQ